MAFVDHTTGGRIILQGIMPIKITLDDTCEVGDLIGYDAISDDAWERADANGKIPAQLVAGEKCETSGDEITCFKMALVDFTSGCTATPGDVVYLSDTAGQYAASATWVPQDLGQMVSARVAFINPSSQMPFGYTTVGYHGAFIRAEVASGRTVPSGTSFNGLRIDVKTVATSVLTGCDIYGLYIFGQIQAVGNAERHMIRLEDGCAATKGFKSFIQFIGGALADPPDFLFSFSTLLPTNNAWKVQAAIPSGNGGQLKLDFGGTTRYVALYTTSG